MSGIEKYQLPKSWPPAVKGALIGASAVAVICLLIFGIVGLIEFATVLLAFFPREVSAVLGIVFAGAVIGSFLGFVGALD